MIGLSIKKTFYRTFLEMSSWLRGQQVPDSTEDLHSRDRQNQLTQNLLKSTSSLLLSEFNASFVGFSS